MSKFHSMVSRRDFMKGLGLAGAGFGAAAAATPVFHDLDELISSPKAVLDRAWYIKEREFGDIGIEVDWNLMKRRDLTGFFGWNGAAKAQALPSWDPEAFNAAVDAKTKEIWPDWEPTTRDYAFSSACGSVGLRSPYYANINQGGIKVNPVPTPEEIGMPVWQGTPEENLLMMRAALSFIGLGPPMGAAELNEKTKNFIWEAPENGTHLVFDDSITETYSTTDPPAIHIPNSLRYALVSYNMGDNEILRRAPSVIGACTETVSYSRVSMCKNFAEEFVRGLGYHCFYGHSYQPYPPWSQLAGIMEHSRMSQCSVSPEYGCYGRTHFVFYTDLPLAFTHPIDAGITRFCETCGICAEACPYGALAPRGTGPNWDNACGQDWADDRQLGGSELMFNIPGYKGWRVDFRRCNGCTSCKASCPFNTVPDGSFIHTIVKATTATTPIFNGFFRQMEDVFHYGKQDKDPESWWHEPKGWPVYGSDPRLLL